MSSPVHGSLIGFNNFRKYDVQDTTHTLSSVSFDWSYEAVGQTTLRLQFGMTSSLVIGGGAVLPQITCKALYRRLHSVLRKYPFIMVVWRNGDVCVAHSEKVMTEAGS